MNDSDKCDIDPERNTKADCEDLAGYGCGGKTAPQDSPSVAYIKKSRDWKLKRAEFLEAEIAVCEELGISASANSYLESRDMRVAAARLDDVLADLAPGNALDEYQKAAGRTGKMSLSLRMRQAVFGLGLGGEAGEVQDIFKKYLGHGHPLDLEKVKKEMGDVLWYIASLADTVGLKLSDIANANIAKLTKRYPDGYSDKASLNRIE